MPILNCREGTLTDVYRVFRIRGRSMRTVTGTKRPLHSVQFVANSEAKRRSEHCSRVLAKAHRRRDAGDTIAVKPAFRKVAHTEVTGWGV